MPALRRSNAEATRVRLLEAGLRAFARKGLAGTNLREDVLAPAGVSVGSFYHQFQDKTDLLLAVLRDAADHFRARLRAVHTPAPGREVGEIVRASYAVLFDWVDEDGDAMRIQIRERDSLDPRVRRFIREDRERWIESLAEDYRRLAATLGVRFDFALGAELIGGLSLATISHYHEIPPQERTAARERLLEGLVRFTVGGVASLPAPEPDRERESP